MFARRPGQLPSAKVTVSVCAGSQDTAPFLHAFHTSGPHPSYPPYSLFHPAIRQQPSDPLPPPLPLWGGRRWPGCARAPARRVGVLHPHSPGLRKPLPPTLDAGHPERGVCRGPPPPLPLRPWPSPPPPPVAAASAAADRLRRRLTPPALPQRRAHPPPPPAGAPAGTPPPGPCSRGDRACGFRGRRRPGRDDRARARASRLS